MKEKTWSLRIQVALTWFESIDLRDDGAMLYQLCYEAPQYPLSVTTSDFQISTLKPRIRICKC